MVNEVAPNETETTSDDEGLHEQHLLVSTWKFETSVTAESLSLSLKSLRKRIESALG